ncbi:site-specific integrase [Chitinimonas sp.]|uniref:tyrosine-type recombinase/integrase n=1 Tax=Chitinimonas sp. TaxID=1934313 RepID=UPI002F948244
MASVQKTAKGYRAQVYVKGQRDSQVFRTQREANAWAARREVELREQSTLLPGERHTFGEALERYLVEVTPTKRSAANEAKRINAYLADPTLPTQLPIGRVTSDMLGVWRDARLKEVKPSSVLRDFSILSAVFECARREWKWIEEKPTTDVRRPKAPEHREVVITWSQIRGMLRALGYSPRHQVREARQAVGACFLLALRTGMRAGELAGLTWDRVADDYAVLPVTKTVPRKVPLSRRALRVVEKMRGYDETLVFGLKGQVLDALFRKYRERAGLSGFTFHDSRHTAATMLARKLDVLDLCKMFGWKNPKMAMVYYNPTASQIASRLG